MEYNGEDIRKAQMEQRQRILKSFGETNLFSGEGDSNKLMRSMEKAEENDIEKAKHQDGDMHPNGRWVWRQSANGGKGDWRVAKKGEGNKTPSGKSSSEQTNKKSLSDFASETSTGALKKVANSNKASSDLKEEAKKELKKRGVEVDEAKSGTKSSESNKSGRKVGDVHPNGKWVWTEYKPGRFDWRGKKETNKKDDSKSELSPSKQSDDNSKKNVDSKTNKTETKTTASKKSFTTKDYELWGHESSASEKGYGIFNPDNEIGVVVRKNSAKNAYGVEIRKQKSKYSKPSEVIEKKYFNSRSEAMKYGIEQIQKTDYKKEDSKKTVLEEITERAGDILKESGVSFKKVASVSPAGDTYAIRYLNTAGVPQVRYYSKTGETRAIGVNAPSSSKIIKNIVSGKESDKKEDSSKKAESKTSAKKEVTKKKVPSGKRINYDDDIVAVYDDKGKKVYEGMLDYSPYQLDDSKWNEKDKNYDLPKGYKMVGK